MRIRLLPDSPLGWTPYAWLVYLSLYIVVGAVTSKTATDWAINAAGLIVFLVLYFRGFWLEGQALLRMALAIVGLGVVLSPHNMGANAFFIYGAAFLGDAVRPAIAFRWLLVIAGVIALEAWLVPLSLQTWAPGLVFSLLIGGTNIHFGEVRRKDQALLAARKDAERLAAVAERERIARDLHDLLGHTLSVIVIKSELASKLADIDPRRAASEIRDVERISRNALSEVRHAIHGFRVEVRNVSLPRLERWRSNVGPVPRCGQPAARGRKVHRRRADPSRQTFATDEAAHPVADPDQRPALGRPEPRRQRESFAGGALFRA